MRGLTTSQQKFLLALEHGGAFDRHLHVLASGESFMKETVLSAFKHELVEMKSGRVVLTARGRSYLEKREAE